MLVLWEELDCGLAVVGEDLPTQNGHAVDQGSTPLGAGPAVLGSDAANCHTLDGDQLCVAGRVVVDADQIPPVIGCPHATSEDDHVWRLGPAASERPRGFAKTIVDGRNARLPASRRFSRWLDHTARMFTVDSDRYTITGHAVLPSALRPAPAAGRCLRGLRPGDQIPHGHGGRYGRSGRY